MRIAVVVTISFIPYFIATGKQIEMNNLLLSIIAFIIFITFVIVFIIIIIISFIFYYFEPLLSHNNKVTCNPNVIIFCFISLHPFNVW